MTFSIVGRCAETGQLGIAISSSSIAVGARCPWLRAGTGAVATQNITLPALGPQILDRLDQGLAPGEALDQALSSNGYGQYRQVTVIDQHGRTALFTGLAAMRAALAAGGEAGPVHSAALSVVGDLLWPVVDLRVDWAEHDPIGQLERLWLAYKPQMQDYVTRALDPTRAPSYGVPGDE